MVNTFSVMVGVLDGILLSGHLIQIKQFSKAKLLKMKPL
jgi:hypothetical protein